MSLFKVFPRSNNISSECMFTTLFAKTEVAIYFLYLVAYLSSYHEKAINAPFELA